MMKSVRILMPVVALGIALGFSGCLGKDDEPAAAATGPIDGVYVQSGMNCNGVAQGTFLPSGATEMRITFANTSGSSAMTFTSGCVKTEAQTASYPAANQVTTTNGAITCSASCTSSECTAGAGSGGGDTLTYSSSGATFKFSKVDTAGTDGCSAGQTVEYVMTKQ